MNKKIWWAALLLVIVIACAGCGQKPGTAAPEQNASNVDAGQENESAPPENSSQVKDEGTAVQSEQTTAQTEESADENSQKQTIDVYYTDPQELELKKSQQEISFSADIEKYTKAFKALQSSGSDDLIPLWGKVELQRLSNDAGALTIDIHIPDEARLGAGGEQFALDALQKTLFQFDEVKTIELLVDGQQVESLMGHMDLDHPMKRDN